MGEPSDEDRERSMRERIEVLEAKVALLEEQLPVVGRGQAQPLDVDEIGEADRERARGWTLHYTVSNSKENVGSFYDHKWESSCTLEGYVIDAAGRKLEWNHVAVGFSRGCTSPAYPKAEQQDTCQDRATFRCSATLTPKIDHWSGWVECRGAAGIARFQWKSKRCG